MGSKPTIEQKPLSPQRHFKEIESTFLPTAIPDYDSFFSEASEYLQQAEQIRATWEDHARSLMALSGIWILEKPRLIDAVQVWCWNLSGCAQGDIMHFKIEILDSCPVINANYGEIPDETREFYQQIVAYAQFLHQQLEHTEEIAKRLVAFNDKMVKMVCKSRAAGMKAGLQGKELVSGLMNNTANAKILLNGSQKIGSCLEHMKKNQEALESELPKIIGSCDDVGQIVHRNGVWNPEKIVEKFHPGAKLSTDEIADLRNRVQANGNTPGHIKKKKSFFDKFYCLTSKE